MELPTAEPDEKEGNSPFGVSEPDLLKDPVRKVGIQPTSHKDADIDAWASVCAKVLYCSEEDFCAHVVTVRKTLKKSSTKPELVAAAKEFGLNPAIAARLNVRNLTAVIAVCQYQSA